jgi:hypothetical protein
MHPQHPTGGKPSDKKAGWQLRLQRSGHPVQGSVGKFDGAFEGRAGNTTPTLKKRIIAGIPGT